MADQMLRTWIGKKLGQAGHNVQLLVEVPNGQQARVTDDSSTGEIDMHLLLADVPKGKLIATFRWHDWSLRVSPSCCSAVTWNIT
jgi:hypothetical protein